MKKCGKCEKVWELLKIIENIEIRGMNEWGMREM